VGVNIKDVHPPIFIADSFEDVIAAYQDKERRINEAIGYRNSSLPRARGDAEKNIKEAESYNIDKVNRAQGEGKRFLDQLSAYKINPDISKRKIYLKSIQEGMTKNKKIIIDPASGMPELWLDSDKIIGALKAY